MLWHTGHQQIIFQRKVTGLLFLDPLAEEIPFSTLTELETSHMMIKSAAEALMRSETY